GASGGEVGGLDRVPGGDGARRPGHARVRAVGDDEAIGLAMSSAGHGFARHGRSACRATFSAFEADLLRSLAAQIIELLRSEAAPAGDTLEGELDFSGPTDEPEDPVL